MTPNTRRKL
jgi:hypothetical protein